MKLTNHDKSHLIRYVLFEAFKDKFDEWETRITQVRGELSALGIPAK